ncbi:MAG: ribosomal protein S18-alanine N-acetyltransferase [Clostridia bacterium]
MRFEPLKFEYLSQMAEIEREAFDMPWTVNMFIPEVESENATYIVGVQDGEVLCYGGFHKVFDEAHITNIAVKSTARGHGVGQFMMSTLIAKARELDIKHMTLEVRDTNEIAIKMYLGFGFKVEGIRKKYYNNKNDALVMWLDI